MEADSAPYQVLGLCFPALSKGHSIIRLDDCRGRPGPHNMLRTSPKPFHTSVDETMIITIVSIAISPDKFGPTFALFMRRRSLLETITNLTRKGVPPPFDVRHHFNAELINYSGTPFSFSFSMTGSQAASSHREGYSVKSIPWSEWGLPVSRWIDAGNRARTWTTTPAGQRWVRLEPVDDGDEKHRVSIIDFNSYNVYNPQDNLPGDLVVGRKGDYFDHGGVFAEEIKMGLGCTIYTAPEVYDYDTWFMDEENVLGLKVCARHDFAILTYGWQSVESQDIFEADVVEKTIVFHFG